MRVHDTSLDTSYWLVSCSYIQKCIQKHRELSSGNNSGQLHNASFVRPFLSRPLPVALFLHLPSHIPPFLPFLEREKKKRDFFKIAKYYIHTKTVHNVNIPLTNYCEVNALQMPKTGQARNTAWSAPGSPLLDSVIRGAQRQHIHVHTHISQFPHVVIKRFLSNSNS